MNYIIIGCIVVISIMISVTARIKKHKLVKVQIRNSYGEIPEKKSEDIEKLSPLWNYLKSDQSSLDTIDDITWNDLEMDKIYNRINVCQSFVGEQFLYAKLHDISVEAIKVEKLETRIKMFEKNPDLRFKVQLMLEKLGKGGDSHHVIDFISTISQIKIPNLQLYNLLNKLLLVLLVVPFLFQNMNLLMWPLFLFCINMGIYMIVKNKYNYEVAILSHVMSILAFSKKLVNKGIIDNEETISELTKYNKQFAKLNRIVSGINLRKNMAQSGDIFGMLLDYIIGGTLYDFVAYKKVIEKLEQQADDYIKLFKLIGEIDVAVCIGSFRESLSLYCEPEYSEVDVIELEEFYHPLIKDPVCNSIRLDKGGIITGSNASGKSTSIKSMMINLLLGQSLNTCMSKRASFPKSSIVTSMSIRDDLENEDSYYIKEIKYLKRIIEMLDSKRLVVCAIDEILRGTNMEERIAATTSVLDYLAEKRCLVVVTTHDIMITDQLQDKYDFYHFRNEFRDDLIYFDYKIYDGIADCKNAIKLLEHVGFPQIIIDNANKIALEFMN